MVTWDQGHLFYLVALRRKQGIEATAWGSLQRDAESHPLVQLKQKLVGDSIAAKKLVLVLPRPDLEMLNLKVPQAEADELAGLIQAEVEQQIGDSDESLVVDFQLLVGSQRSIPVGFNVVGREKGKEDELDDLSDEGATQSAVAFSMEPGLLERWQQIAGDQQWQIEAITSRQLATLAQLKRNGVFASRLSVLASIYEGEVELAFLRGGDLAFLRTFRVSSHALDSLADQIQTEVQRSISMLALGDDAVRPELYLLKRPTDCHVVAGDGHETKLGNGKDAAVEHENTVSMNDLCESLDAKMVGLKIDIAPSAESDEPGAMPEPALIGAAIDVLDANLVVDLIHPKRPPKPPNPWVRWGAIGGFALLATSVAGYTLMADLWDLQDQVESKRSEVDKAKKLASKFQEQGDETRYVQSWLSDQVDWLAQLQALSSQFAPGQAANVRRLSASTDGGMALFSLSIQIRDPKEVAQWEDRLRIAKFTVTSKRLSEQAGNPEYPWQFEASVATTIPSLEDREETEVFRSPSQISEAGEEAEANASDQGTPQSPVLEPQASAVGDSDTRVGDESEVVPTVDSTPGESETGSESIPGEGSKAESEVGQ